MAARADKVVPWFAGWPSPWSLLAEATSIASARAPMTESGVGSADGLLPYGPTVPGSHRAGPCDPGGAPYGRTEYGRPRCARGRIPGTGKGLSSFQACGIACDGFRFGLDFSRRPCNHGRQGGGAACVGGGQSGLASDDAPNRPAEGCSVPSHSALAVLAEINRQRKGQLSCDPDPLR